MLTINLIYQLGIEDSGANITSITLHGLPEVTVRNITEFVRLMIVLADAEDRFWKS